MQADTDAAGRRARAAHRRFLEQIDSRDPAVRQRAAVALVKPETVWVACCTYARIAVVMAEQEEVARRVSDPSVSDPSVSAEIERIAQSYAQLTAPRNAIAPRSTSSER
jgi:hypothetical protein